MTTRDFAVSVPIAAELIGLTRPGLRYRIIEGRLPCRRQSPRAWGKVRLADLIIHEGDNPDSEEVWAAWMTRLDAVMAARKAAGRR